MSFKSENQPGGGDYTPQEALEAGTYPGRLVQIVSMGLQPQRAYQGTPKDPKECLYTGYELSHEFMKDDEGNDDVTKPRWVGEDFPFYNLEADRAKSTLRYIALDPQGTCGGDWEKVLSFPCNITLSKEPRKGKEGQFVNYITHVSGPTIVPGYTQPELVNPVRIFDIETPDMEVFKLLPKWLQDKLKTNLNFNGSALQTALSGETSTQAPTTATPPSSASATPPVPPVPAASNGN